MRLGMCAGRMQMTGEMAWRRRCEVPILGFEEGSFDCFVAVC